MNNRVIGLLTLAFLGMFCLCCGGCGLGYMNGGLEFSDGYREGTIQKFSHKGWIWKTDEGEMAMQGFKQTSGDNPTMSNVFAFTVSDSKIKDEITALRATDKVRLHYKQFILVPPWRGDTEYFIYKVEKVSDLK